jgi:hypothetical protein
MDAPGFATRSFRDGLNENIAPVHPDFVCGICRFSLTGLAGWLSIAFAHSRAAVILGLANQVLTCLPSLHKRLRIGGSVSFV